MRTSFKPDERGVQFGNIILEAWDLCEEIYDAMDNDLGADPEMVTLADVENARRLRDELKPIADRLAGRG